MMKWYSFNATILFLSSMLALNTDSWLLMWVLMEINVVGMAIQLMEDPKKEKLIVFFIFQSLPSMAVMLYLVMSWSTSNLANSIHNTYFVTMAMLCKMGMFPLHMWVLKMSKSISWLNNLIMMSWQKIIPLTLMTKIMPNMMMMMVATVSAGVLAIYLLYSSGLKMFFVSSSMVHMGWMIMSTNSLGVIALLYLTMYSVTLMMVTKEMSSKKSNSLMNLENKSTAMKINMLSLAGFPPLMGFLLKASIAMTLVKFKTPIKMTMVMLMTAVISFYTYAQIFLKTIFYEAPQQMTQKKGQTKTLSGSSAWNIVTPTLILFQ